MQSINRGQALRRSDDEERRSIAHFSTFQAPISSSANQTAIHRNVMIMMSPRKPYIECSEEAAHAPKSLSTIAPTPVRFYAI